MKILFILLFILSPFVGKAQFDHPTVNLNHELHRKYYGDSLRRYESRLRVMQGKSVKLYGWIDHYKSHSIDSTEFKKMEVELDDYINYLSYRGVNWNNDIVWKGIMMRFEYFEEKIISLSR